MSVIQVTNVDYLNLIEDIRSEADRLIAQSVSTLLMRYFVSNEYVMLSGPAFLMSSLYVKLRSRLALSQ